MMKRSLILLARLSFAVTIILIPVHWRETLLSRPNPPVYGDYTDFLLFASDIAMLAVLIFWILSFLVEPRKISFGPAHIWIPLLGLTLAGWLSLINSWDVPLTAYHALRFSILFLFFLFIINEIHSPEWVVVPAAVQVLIQSTFAIGQSLLQDDLGFQAIGEYDLDPLRQGTSVLTAGGGRFLRAYGLSAHPNILGGCLAVGLLILLAGFIYSHRSQIYDIALVIVIGLGSIALMLTFSRSAWLAFIAGSLLIVGVEVSKRNTKTLKRIMILGLICILGLTPFLIHDLPYLSSRLNTGNSFSNNQIEQGSLIERVYLFEAALYIFVDNMPVGIGLGVSVTALREAYPLLSIRYEPPHFTLVASALETGVIGAAFYFGLMLFPFVFFIWQRQRIFQIPASIAAFSVMLALMVIGLFDHYTWMLVPGRALQWLAWGIWSASIYCQKSGASQNDGQA